MSTATLTSLAILKTYLDEGKDYLDNLRPFILQVLVDHRPHPIRSHVVSALIRQQFGLKVPDRTVEIVLKRLVNETGIARQNHVYQIVGELPDPQIAYLMSEAQRHIDSVVAGLLRFTEGGVKPISSTEEGVTAICSFLARFDVTCLRAYLFGSAIPQLQESDSTDVVQVSEYVKGLQLTDPTLFESFLVLVQGHMLANALLCPDLENAHQSYQNVTFYMDTPLLVPLLGLEDDARRDAVLELIALLKGLGGRIAVFSHTRNELYSVIRRNADFLESIDGRGPIIYEARKRGTKKSDLLLIAATLEDKLDKLGVEIIDSPRYTSDFQIDESIFEQMLEFDLKYNNPRAKEFDINSVRSIYAIRENIHAYSLETCRAVLVTNNAAFAKIAWDYGRHHEASHNVSVVITEFSLANLAWLKAPMDSPKIPRTQLMAFCYAALRPSIPLLNKFMSEIEKLQQLGEISESEHQLLRSSTLAEDELMRLTLGEDKALTKETTLQTLNRATKEITKDGDAKLEQEKEAHGKTRETLAAQEAKNKEIVENIRSRCQRNSRLLALAISTVVALALAVGLFGELGVVASNPILRLIVVLCSATYLLFSLANLLVGFTFLPFHKKLQDTFLRWCLRREAKSFGISLNEFFD